MSNPRWNSYVDQLRPAGDLLAKTWAPGDPQIAAEFHRQLMMNLALGYFCYFQMDLERPDFTPWLNSVFMLQPNPDDTYYNALIDPRGTYRISGERGSVHILTCTIGRNQMGMTADPGVLIAEFELGPLADRDGRIDILFSAKRPPDHVGHWHVLDPQAEFIMVRQRSYRWGEEADARLAIQRLDTDPFRPRLPAAEVDDRLEKVIAFTRRLSNQWLDYVQGVRDRLPPNEARLTHFAGGVAVQRYWEAIYSLGEGEALILETELPTVAPYWNVQLNDMLFNAVEFLHRQSSLNGAQARIDADGRFRAVISAIDPGVPNWLDTMGHTTGTMIGRWYACDSAPLPSLRKVKLDDVRSALPADTPVVSADERREVMRARARGGQIRRRW